MQKTNVGMIVASIFMLLFVASDLLFDFAFNFNASDYIAFGFTLAAAIITFVATYKLKRQEILTAFDKTTAFVQSNFNNCQVVFSILDIVCGIISILAGLVFIGGVFKFVKVFYFLAKFFVVTNKTKALAKSVGKFSLLWTAGRILTKKQGGEMSTKKISKTQIIAIILIICGAVYGALAYFYPVIQIAGDYAYTLASVLGLDSIVGLIGTIKGYGERTKEELEKIAAKAQAKTDLKDRAIIAEHDAKEKEYQEAMARQAHKAGQAN